jgi:hypothetical protein
MRKIIDNLLFFLYQNYQRSYSRLFAVIFVHMGFSLNYFFIYNFYINLFILFNKKFFLQTYTKHLLSNQSLVLHIMSKLKYLFNY